MNNDPALVDRDVNKMPTLELSTFINRLSQTRKSRAIKNSDSLKALSRTSERKKSRSIGSDSRGSSVANAYQDDFESYMKKPWIAKKRSFDQSSLVMTQTP